MWCILPGSQKEDPTKQSNKVVQLRTPAILNFPICNNLTTIINYSRTSD